MKAVVLVGGEGTRLRPLTLSTPKPMLPVAEVPMIERVVAHLASHGIDEVVLSLGYRPDAFLVAFPDNTCAGVRLTYAVEPARLGTAGGIAFAARAVGLDSAFVVVNGDVLTDLDLSELIAFHGASGGEATIALTPVDDPSAFGVVPTADDGRVTAFIEKPPVGSAPTNFINAGFYMLEPSVVSRVPVDGVMSIEHEVFPSLVADGVLFALGSSRYWTDTGTPSLYLRANLDYVRGLRSVPPAPGAKERSSAGPGVWTLGASVIDGSVVAPSLIGDAAFVAGSAVVEESIVGGGARVEAGAVVRRSLLLPGAVVRSDAMVTDSIVGEGAVIGHAGRVSELTVVQGRAVVGDGASLAGERVSA
ncbi:MAG: mannose-phosphate guanylyltransferase [Actinomycetota bacterium]|jgi:NDP-sugar pyrophosphorylase family protein|nr:mannose-phosphate guanylyltransferase [Actinomycetota bacterium]